MIIGLWNYAVKVSDLTQAANFYVSQLGGEVVREGVVLGSRYVMVHLGQTRILLMDRAPYEDELRLDLPPGLLHVVFEVDNFAAHVEKLRSGGVRFLTVPRIIDTGFDRRQIVFVESPEGIRTEIMQILG